MEQHEVICKPAKRADRCHGRSLKAHTNNRPGRVVDLFCGIGGLSHGFLLEGFTVAAGIDTDATCSYAYERNNNNAEFLKRDIQDIQGVDLNEYFHRDEPKILVGCAPCQPFSTYTNGGEQGRWRLLRDFSRIIRESQPDIVSMENVPRLVSYKGGHLFQEFEQKLEDDGYFVWWNIIKCADYGVPQLRKRLVLLASKLGEIELVPPTHEPENYITVKDAISTLPPISAGECDAEDALHRSSRLTEINLARIRASKPGGSWRDWDQFLVANCHKKKTGESYSSVYGRMMWNELGPTITTQCYGFGNGRFGHPEQDRAISLREAALLQTFPRNYQFSKSGEQPNTSTVARWIGNAVPVELARAIAKSVSKNLKSYGC